MSSSDWKEVKLGDAIIFNPRESITKKQVAKRIAMEKLKPFTKFIDDYEVAEFNGGTKFRNGDTLLARITPCLENGKTSQVTILDDNEVGFGSTEYIVLREKVGVTDKDYIYYMSISPNFRNVAIKSMVGSSGRQRVQQEMLENADILLPSISEQKVIADTLSCLDDKIELNNRISKTLEEMAQAIFKSWFVDFEPFQDGEFEDSELGRIPKGWRVGKINDIVEVTDYVANGSFAALKKNCHYVEENIGYAVLIRLVDYNNDFGGPFVWVDEKGYYFLKKSKLFGGEIIISNVGVNAGTVFRAPKLSNPMTLGPNSIMLLMNMYNNYIYYYLSGYIGQEKMNGIKTGSAQPKFNKTDFRNIELVLPSDLSLDKFNALIDPIIQKVEQIDIEVKNLISIRDTLLPKLMSGEIRVPIEEVQ